MLMFLYVMTYSENLFIFKLSHYNRLLHFHFTKKNSLPCPSIYLLSVVLMLLL